ncbi:MFS general substrate transporter [Melanogaster broomeanus]|nr:MFS general substrate transporter [Melanogaster broomeanus]
MSSALKTTSDTPPRGELESGDSIEGKPNCTVAPTLTAEQETKLWRKIDLRVVPIISVMYLFAFTDRGFAAINGLMTQLDLTGNKFNIVLSILIVFFEVPANIVIQVVRPSRQAHDIRRFHHLTLIQPEDGFQGSWYHQLLAVRVCLGAAEAGLYPGIAYYITTWYPKYKLQFRIALFAGSAGLAGAFAGFLGYAMGGMNGVGGLETWSWIFNIEESVKIFDGIGTLLAGIIAAFLTYSRARKACIPQDNEHGAVQQIWAAFTDWQVWSLSVVLFSVTAPCVDLTSAFALSYFLPLGYSTAVSQILTIPLYLIATNSDVLRAAAVLLFAYYSDKARLRSPFIFAGQCITLVGFIINILEAPSGVKYFGLVLCITGSAGGIGVISWLANNLGGTYKRATGMALQLTVGTVGGVVASNIFRSQDAPRYIFGGTGLVAILISAIAYKRINAARDCEELLLQQQGEKAQHKEGGGKPIAEDTYTCVMDTIHWKFLRLTARKKQKISQKLKRPQASQLPSYRKSGYEWKSPR